MASLSGETVIKWVSSPLFYIGQAPVTLGGLGSAAFVVMASFVVSALIQRAMANRLTKRLGLNPGVAYAIGRILHYSVVFVGFILAAQCIGLNLGSLAVVLGFLSVGIGFGLQNITSNFISGLILLLERPISVGDFISVEHQVGRVVNVGMRSTLIRTIDNLAIIIPNSTLIEHQVINWSRGDPRVRLHVPVGVAYGSNTAQVTDTLINVAKQHPDVLEDPKPQVHFLGFGDSALQFELLSWIDEPEKQFVVRSELNYAIEAAFRAAGINIPFPQRDVNVQLTPAIERLAAPQGR